LAKGSAANGFIGRTAILYLIYRNEKLHNLGNAADRRRKILCLITVCWHQGRGGERAGGQKREKTPAQSLATGDII
jgi:hypothetical protein